jgi:hypothetical protein
MPVYTLGGSHGEAPFSRTFFNVTLGDILEKDGKEKDHRLTLFLADGALLDVCSIEELADQYVMLRAYRRSEDACDLSLNLVPYSLIYRIELAPKATQGDRVGFHWAPPSKARATSRRPGK